MKVKETAKKPYGICPASMTIWNADQTYNKKGILGSYALRNNMFDVGAMLLIAVIGYFFLKLEIPIAPIVLALILGPLAESNQRRSMLQTQGSASTFFTRPICIFFLLLAVTQITAFAKGHTPYPRWCWIFSPLVGGLAAQALGFLGNLPALNAIACAWLAIGCLWMFGGLLCLCGKAR